MSSYRSYFTSLTAFIFSTVSYIVGASWHFFREAFQLDAKTILNFGATPSLASVAYPSPGANRSFWSRLTARSDDPVPYPA